MSAGPSEPAALPAVAPDDAPGVTSLSTGLRDSHLTTELWMGEVTVYEDDVGASVEKCALVWDEAVFKWAVDKVFRYAAQWFEGRVGVAPTAKKIDLRAKQAEIDALKTEVREAMATLAKSFCLTDFDADVSYFPPPVRMGYLLKYGLYNACLAAAVLLRHQNVVVPWAVGAGGGMGAGATTPLHVACFGGGPATDYLAVKTMALRLGVPLRVKVYDLPHWRGFWDGEDLTGEADAPPPAAGAAVQHCGEEGARIVNIGADDNARFRAADILAQESLVNPLRDGDDDDDADFCRRDPCLVTLFYTANEMANAATTRAHFIKFMAALAARIPPGSSVVLLDRTRKAVTSLLEDIALQLADVYETVVLSRRVEPVLPVPLINLVADYTARFGVRPRVAGKAGLTIFKVRARD